MHCVGSCRMLKLITWSLTLSLFTLEVNSNAVANVQSRYQLYQDARPCICLRTSGCEVQNFNQPGTNISPTPANYSVEHFRFLVREFQIQMQICLDTVEEAQRVLAEDRKNVSVIHWGLRSLYPLRNDSHILTETLPRNKHRVHREIRWLLTAAKAQILWLHKVNVVDQDMRNLLKSKIEHVSSGFTSLLRVFGITGLPEQTCVQTSGQLNATEVERLKFTSMALRDVHRAIHHIKHRFASCEVQTRARRPRHVELDCGSTTVSAFYTHVPENISILYHSSQVLAPLTY